MNKTFHQIQRYFNTVKHLKSVQVSSRIKYMIKMKWYQYNPEWTKRKYIHKKKPAVMRGSKFLMGLDIRPHAPQSVGDAEHIRNGKFTFLNKTVDFGSLRCMNWSSGESPLWKYHLHYFNYAWDLGLAYLDSGKESYYACFKELVESWVSNSKVGIGTGWQPYPISIRVVNWIHAYYLFQRELEQDELFKRRFIQSIYHQVRFLSNHLEYHVLGNHLLENGKALIFGGLFFQGQEADAWLSKGIQLLEDEASEQILADGGHFELSPMYHTIVLSLYLESIHLLEMNQLEVPSAMEQAAEGMLAFLSGLLHPDGQYPLFNDSVFLETTSPLEALYFGSVLLGERYVYMDGEKLSAKMKVMLGQARINRGQLLPMPSQPISGFKDSGYFVFRNRAMNSALIMDCGQVGPRYLPGHGHADIMNYELSLYGKRYIVDSGVYEYTTGQARDYYRSTRAHNTVTVNGGNQSDVWGSFRVGRRGAPTEARIADRGHYRWFKGSHDSYLETDKVTHTRYFLEINDELIIILDEISTSVKKPSRYVSHVHFHPDVQLTRMERSSLELNFHGSAQQLLAFGSVGVNLKQIRQDGPLYAYCPSFGKADPKLTLDIEMSASESAVFGYALVPGHPTPKPYIVESRFASIEDYAFFMESKDNDTGWTIAKRDGEIIVEMRGEPC